MKNKCFQQIYRVLGSWIMTALGRWGGVCNTGLCKNKIFVKAPHLSARLIWSSPFAQTGVCSTVSVATSATVAWNVNPSCAAKNTPPCLLSRDTLGAGPKAEPWIHSLLGHLEMQLTLGVAALCTLLFTCGEGTAAALQEVLILLFGDVASAPAVPESWFILAVTNVIVWKV